MTPYLRATLAAALLLTAAPAAARAQQLPSPADTLPADLPATGAAVSSPAPAPADSTVRTLAAGDRFRLWSGGRRYDGVVKRVAGDTLVVSGGAAAETALQRGDVSRVERLAARTGRGRSIVRGGLIGAVVGTGLGLVAGRLAAPGDKPCDSTAEPCGGDGGSLIKGSLLAEGAFFGLIVGGMLGPSWRGERWEPAQLPARAAPASASSARATPHPPRGVALGFSLRI